MRKHALTTALVLALALPSCGGDTPTPTQPGTPTLGPAQLTVQITVSQATAATSIGPTGPAKQKRTVNTTVTVSNAANSSAATISAMRIFGTILAGGNVSIIDVSSTPPPPNIVGPAGIVSIHTDVDFLIPEPFGVDAPFDLSAEVVFADELGNSGTTPPTSRSRSR